MVHSRLIAIAAVVVLIAGTATEARSQSYLLPQAPEKSIWIEAAHPNLKGFLNVDALSSIWYASARIPLNSQIKVMVEVPLAHARFGGNDFFEAKSNTVLGNPYIGGRYLLTPEFAVELGLRLPLTTADEESWADVIAVLSNLQRMEAFATDFFPVSASAIYQRDLAPGFNLRTRAGVTQAFYTGDDVRMVDSSLMIDYGAFGTYSVGVARLGAGLSGRWDTSIDDSESFGDASWHQVGMTVDAGFGRYRPGLSVLIPLDNDYRQFLGSTIGAYVQIALP